MKVILTKSVKKLGTIGSVIEVARGYFSNHLHPIGVAVAATKENIELFERVRDESKLSDIKHKEHAVSVAKVVGNIDIFLSRPASDDGNLYGSVSASDIVKAIADTSSSTVDLVDRKHITILTPIRSIGVFHYIVTLHPEVELKMRLSVGRSIDEAQSILKNHLAKG